MIEFQSVHEAFHGKVKEVLDRGEWAEPVTSTKSVGSQFGKQPRKTLELIGDKFTVKNPRDRLLPDDCRQTDPSFIFANYLWTIAGDSSSNFILAYNNQGSKFLDSKGTFQCAFPDRVSSTHPDNPLAQVIRILKEDPSSRRALIPAITTTDLVEEPLDFPCFASLHFIVRNDRLSLITHMRSQSLIGVLPYDIYLLTMMQETVATELGIEVGPYHHLSNSLHIYENEVEKAKDILNCSSKTSQMDKMPPPTPLSNNTFLEAERKIRLSQETPKLGSIYWDNLFSKLKPISN